MSQLAPSRLRPLPWRARLALLGDFRAKSVRTLAHRTSHIAHRTSHIAHRTSHIAHRKSHIAHRTSPIGRRGDVPSAARNAQRRERRPTSWRYRPVVSGSGSQSSVSRCRHNSLYASWRQRYSQDDVRAASATATTPHGPEYLSALA
jgi:hypothetical protein